MLLNSDKFECLLLCLLLIAVDDYLLCLCCRSHVCISIVLRVTAVFVYSVSGNTSRVFHSVSLCEPHCSLSLSRLHVKQEGNVHSTLHSFTSATKVRCGVDYTHHKWMLRTITSTLTLAALHAMQYTSWSARRTVLERT